MLTLVDPRSSLKKDTVSQFVIPGTVEEPVVVWGVSPRSVRSVSDSGLLPRRISDVSTQGDSLLRL